MAQYIYNGSPEDTERLMAFLNEEQKKGTNTAIILQSVINLYNGNKDFFHISNKRDTGLLMDLTSQKIQDSLSTYNVLAINTEKRFTDNYILKDISIVFADNTNIDFFTINYNIIFNNSDRAKEFHKKVQLINQQAGIMGRLTSSVNSQYKTLKLTYNTNSLPELVQILNIVVQHG